MSVDLVSVLSLVALGLQLLALAAIGYIVVRVALRQSDEPSALAQGLVIGPALWGLTTNYLLHLLPGSIGVVSGWLLLVAIGIALTWRTRETLSPRLKHALPLAAAALAMFCVAFASRQQLGTADSPTHLALASSVRAGNWPLVLPWIPDQPIHYHYGADLLVGMLASFEGIDITFATEVFGAYLWTSLFLVIAMLLRKIGGFVGLVVLAPLLLTSGAWSMIGEVVSPPDIVQIAVPTGLPSHETLNSLHSIYIPEGFEQPATEYDTSPPNITRSHFVFAYALGMVVLERVTTRDEASSWTSAIALASAIGFLSLLSEEIALLTIASWMGLEAATLLPLRSSRLTWVHRTYSFLAHRLSLSPNRDSARNEPSQALEKATQSRIDILRIAVGPALATLFLISAGGPITTLLSGTAVTGTTLDWIDDPGSRRPFGTMLHQLPGGLALFGLGALPVTAVALLLAWRNRLVVTLAGITAIFVIVALTLQYKAYPLDMTRMDGHARTFALFAFLVALGLRLSNLHHRWRYVSAVGIVALMTWPTIATPITTLQRQLSHGIHLEESTDPDISRSVAHFIRTQTGPGDRILSSYPAAISSATGRPNASGFRDNLHLLSKVGPVYADAKDYLYPQAIRDLRYSFYHATNTTTERLPDRSRQWLNNPRYFDLLIRDGEDALYRIRPAFLELQATPHPQSYESLRRIIPAGSSVYLTEGLDPLSSARLASTLDHTRVLGDVNPSGLHLLSPIATESYGTTVPDVIVIPEGSTSFLKATSHSLGPSWTNPVLVWTKNGIDVYASTQTASGIVQSRPSSDPQSKFSTQLTEFSTADGSVTLALSLIDDAPNRWTGQDWVVVPVEDTDLALPKSIALDRHNLIDISQWYSGQIVPGQGTTTHEIEFSSQLASFAVRNAHGDFDAVRSSGDSLKPGTWALTLRLRADSMQAAVIPILRITVSRSGDVSYVPYAVEVSTIVEPCPEHLIITDSCRQFTSSGHGN